MNEKRSINAIPHPVLIIGIILCVAPSFALIFKWTLPGWIYGLGILAILIGGLLTIFKQ